MSILSTNQKLIKVGHDYSAGSGISIENDVISVTGEFGKTYSAGENIDIYEQGEQLYISSKDWEQDIANASANAYNEAVAQIPAPFDPTYLSAQIDNKLNESDFTAWQSGQYATDLQTVEGQINNKLDTSSFSEVSSTFLTAINIPESATWNEVSQAYEQASGTYLTAISIPESATWNDVSTTVQTNSATWGQGGAGDEEVNSFVYNNSATINEVNTSYQTNSGNFLTAAPADMATTGDVAELAQTISETYQVKGDYLVRSDSANFYPANNPSSFATEDWVTAQGYITGVSIPDSATWNEVSTAYQNNSATYLTAHQDLSDYYTTADANTLSSMLSGAIDYVSANAGDEFPVSADEAIQYVQTNSATIDDVNTSYQTNSGTFLTAHQAISAEEWNDCYDNVNTNSGAWGGEALPISSRDGIDLEIDNGTLYIGVVNPLLYPIEFVSTSAAATGTNILYVVTGS